MLLIRGGDAHGSFDARFVFRELEVERVRGAVSASPTLAAVVKGEAEEPAWVSGAEEAKLRQYDPPALEALPGLYPSLLDYLRRHREEVLVPERGGPESR